MLSVIIIAKNEEKKLPDCLKSIHQLADEIVVIDNASIDKTAEIARKYGANIIKAPKKLTLKYSQLRNLGLEKARGKWVFYVDADERVSPELKDEILRLVSLAQDDKREYVAYAMPRKNIILGHEMKHGGWWPDYVKRLFLKKALKKWIGQVHEEPVLKDLPAGRREIGHLKNPLIHIKHNDLSEMVEKTNNWSEIEAKLMFKADHPKMNILRFLSAMWREFWLRMIKKAAFLDGAEGIIYALYQVYSRFISYAKLWEMQIKTKN